MRRPIRPLAATRAGQISDRVLDVFGFLVRFAVIVLAAIGLTLLIR